MGRRKERTGDGAFFLGFLGYGFTWRSFFGRPSGGPIFRCTTKDRGERRAKGLRPLESPGVNSDSKPDVLWLYLLATVHLTRLSRAWRAPHCFHALCVLRPEGEAPASPEEVPLGCGAHNDCKTPATTRLSSLQNAGYSISVTNSPQLEQYNRVRGSSAKRGPRRSPTKWVRWGKEEQGSERSFCRRQKRS